MTSILTAAASAASRAASGIVTTGALTLAILLAPLPALAADAGLQVVKPGRGISLDVGATKVAGYYEVAENACRVTLMMGARADIDGRVAKGISRIELPVASGRSSRVMTPEGRGLDVTCGPSARILTISTRDLVVSLR